jgi:hypothetical protein
MLSVATIENDDNHDFRRKKSKNKECKRLMEMLTFQTNFAQEIDI